jgi:hypothetical protein
MAFVDCRLENIGKANATEVVQLYLGLPAYDIPTRQLRSFVKKTLAKGAADLIRFDNFRRDLSI